MSDVLLRYGIQTNLARGEIKILCGGALGEMGCGE